MPTSIHDFDYILPPDRIAQTPAVPRESAKLMVLDRKEKTITHHHVSDLPIFFRKGDALVVNNTKVFRARLKSGNKELFLLRPVGTKLWQAIGRNISKDMRIPFADDFVAHVHEKFPDGILHVSFNQKNVIDFANTYGEVPTPPYIKTIPKDDEYQTSYAKYVGSVAAPTAGFHFTPAIRESLKNKGVTILEITLHVGLGTFLPIKSETLEEHPIHSEWVDVSAEVSKLIMKAKKEKRRIIAVGTTTVRTLEGTGAKPYQGDVNLFIQPGYKFSVVDNLITNFHLPKSTLLVLVSAFAGREFILNAYKEAVEMGYRFYSFGDAMLIV